jgi:alginate O-acetyltransferase complex protein AlgI
MIFSSWQFILLFLPGSVLIYFWLNHRRLIVAGKASLVVASLFFYAYWEIRYLPLILGTIAFNFFVGRGLARSHRDAPDDLINRNHSRGRKAVLAAAILANLLLLSYYKYTDFFLSNVNFLMSKQYDLPHIVLPLAISFFTFTQIVYLVDSYRGETAHYSVLNYALFVTFFPHLIAGPIVHHRQIMSQFESKRTLRPRYSNILKGLFIFSIGLFKKVVIADTFAVWANAGFDGGQALNFYAAWATSLSYTFQLYFDFSGYCDMAIGASLLFNIWLPINFNSPYKALDIQSFWRRWHITLSSFLRDYLYIPLGGNRCGATRAYFNLFITFILGGLWHGATWMFVIWGALHGCGLLVHRLWRTTHLQLPRAVAWVMTFIFVNVTWVFFRAKSLDDAIRILMGMVDIDSILQNRSRFNLTADLAWGGWLSDKFLVILPAALVGQLPIYLAIGLALILVAQKNTIELVASGMTTSKLIYGILLFAFAMQCMLTATSTVFLYFNF